MVVQRLGLTRARMTWLLDLLLVAPYRQTRVLVLEADADAEPLAEQTLREVAHTAV